MYVFKKLYNILNKQNKGRNSNNNDMTDPHILPRDVYHGEFENREDMVQDLMIPPHVDENIVNTQMASVSDQIENEETQTEVPSVYINAAILEQFLGVFSYEEKRNSAFIYEINGIAFRENDTDVNELLRESDKLMEFELIDQLSYDNDDILKEIGDNECTTLKTDLIQKQFNTDASELPIVIQNTPYGLIINSNILLTENGWNTIVCGDNTACIACNRSLDIREIADHIASVNHKYIINKYSPLAEFDMNIVRKITNVYHCAICNTTFDDIEHLESLSHGDKLLKSINKVSDITQTDMNNFDIYRNENRNRDNDCINFNAIVEDSSGFDSESFDGFYDDASVNYCNESETEDNDSNQQTDQNIFSYADIAKKPKTFITSKYVQIKLDDKYAKVKFESWHMIVILKTNNFYCMACKVTEPIRFKTEHCIKVAHVENVLKCKIVRDFKEHVIRKVDDKLYHCGHCNNLQMIHEIREHIESTHMKRNVVANRNLSEKVPLNKCTVIRSTSTSPKITNNDSKNKSSAGLRSATSSPISANNDSKIAGNRNNENIIATPNVPRNNDNPTTNVAADAIHKDTAVSNEIQNPSQLYNVALNQVFNVQPFPNVLPTENDKIVIREFGQTYTISLLAYHLIQRRGPDAYFCLICEVWCMNVWCHILDPVHTTRIAKTGFLPKTSFHLIRQTKYGFNCVVCNIFIRNNPISHTWEPMHLAVLKREIQITALPPNVPNFPIGAPIFYQNQATTSVQNPNETSETNVNIRNDGKIKNSEIKDNENKDNEKRNNENKLTETIDENDFDTEEYVYVKIKNNYTKITRAAYNSLVQTGNGARYCVLCSTDVFGQDLKAHLSSTDHLLNMKKYKFLEKFERHLIRQMPTCYHCALCNVCIIRSFLNDHISWPPHKETEANKIVKHIRRNEIKSGVKEIACATQKEIVNNDIDIELKILVNIEFRLHAQHDIVKKKKIVMINGTVLKLSWDAFHGVCKTKNGYKCLICQTDFKNYELSAHIDSSGHLQILEDYQLEFSPALIRKVNNSTLHCLTCNIEINNEEHTINDHKDSKRHVKKYIATVADKTDSDILDNKDILILKGNDCVNKKKKSS